VVVPRVRLEMKPVVRRRREIESVRLVYGMLVRERRAREAFWRCEQTWESVTRDISFFFFIIIEGEEGLVFVVEDDMEDAVTGFGLAGETCKPEPRVSG
jgi:hypothetical protein